MSEEGGEPIRSPSASSLHIIPESPLPPPTQHVGESSCGSCGSGCGCASSGHYAPEVGAGPVPCLPGFAAPVQMVQNPSFTPAQLRPQGQESGVFYPAAVCPAAVSFSLSPQPPQLGFIQLEAPRPLPPQMLRPPAVEASVPARPPAKRPPPREPSLDASSSAATLPPGPAEAGPRRGGKKALRMAGPPVRSHSTSELCLEERNAAQASGESLEDAVFAPETETRMRGQRQGLRKSSRASALTASELIDLTFQSDEEMSDDVSVVVPSDRATVGSSSVHGSEAQFGGDEVEVVAFDESSNQSSGDVSGAVEVPPPPPPYDFSDRQQLHRAPIASPRLQGSASGHSHAGGGPSPSSLHPHAAFFTCPAYPVQCPHATCSCHLRPRAPCSYWTGCPAAALYCHHHHHLAPPRAPGGPGQQPCPLHSPCPHTCPFEAAAPRPVQEVPPPEPVHLVPEPQPHQASTSLGSASLRQLQAAGVLPPQEHKPEGSEQGPPPQRRQPPRAAAGPRRGPPPQGGGWCGGSGRRSAAQPLQHQRRMPHQQLPWPPQLQVGGSGGGGGGRPLSLPPRQHTQYQAQVNALTAQREATNRWFDAQRQHRQRHPAGQGPPPPPPPLTYAAAPPASVVHQAAAAASVAGILSAAASAAVPASVLPAFDPTAGTLLHQAAAEAAVAANYQRMQSMQMAQRSGSPLVYTTQYPYQAGAGVARAPARPTAAPTPHHHLSVYPAQQAAVAAAAAQQQTLRNAAAGAAGQINIVVSPTGPSLPAQAAAFTSFGASNLMTASLPMQVDHWNLFTMQPGPPFLMHQLGVGDFPAVGTFSLAQAAAAEPQPVGASLDTIERCTKKALWVVQDVPEGEEERCTVCLSEFEANETIRTLACDHLFHTGCIDRWLTYNKKCPVCRVEVDTKAAAAAGTSRHPGPLTLNAA